MRKFIYEFDFGGAKEWVLASNRKEAIECHNGFTDCEDYDDVKIMRIPRSKWKNYYIINADTGNELESFEEFALRTEAPDFIASTEY